MKSIVLMKNIVLLIYVAWFFCGCGKTDPAPPGTSGPEPPAALPPPPASVAQCEKCVILSEQSQNRIAIVDLPSKTMIWEWSAAMNTTIPAAHIQWLSSPTEAKPVYNNKYILLTGEAVALVRIADKKLMFYAYVGGNVHSAELLPDGNIVAASSAGNKLTLVKVDTLHYPDNVYTKTYPINDGHNVVWDKKRQVLWAGSALDLQAYTYNFDCAAPGLTFSYSLTLPEGLHDLFPVYGEDALWLSGGSKVYQYKFDTKQFEVIPIAQSSVGVKSVSSGPAGFPTIIIRSKISWWTDEILSMNGESLYMQNNLRIYKARWLLENIFSYSADGQFKQCN
ncbi:hypothetical protein FW774_18145 [Pedobacter sp. BS3]|uniref:DUF6528 family protein n=1 Tax=Pedobacter sp. BS3 TaxID=2567937 RepID=UPI0011EC8E28|nr:DUF6528 family protein [Pedobacter sp. BS3]TZF81482.1 hypothetical protein FW774_18145 [Pedobacter sp. BS3]